MLKSNKMFLNFRKNLDLFRTGLTLDLETVL